MPIGGQYPLDQHPLTVEAVYGRRAEQFYRDGAWRPGLLIDQLDEWAAAEPRATCLHEGDLALRVGDLRDRSLQLARRLRELGLAAGDRVAVQLPNWHEVREQGEFSASACAVSRAGAGGG